jgi:hypothetical protein
LLPPVETRAPLGFNVDRSLPPVDPAPTIRQHPPLDPAPHTERKRE